MPKHVAPGRANGPSYPPEPREPKGIFELVKRLAERLSEEALVVVAILAFKAFMDFEGKSGLAVDFLSLFALAGYLSLRFLGRFRF
jgi:hypothetical protein